ncbi:DUF2179 domain-containing protein [Clostridium sp. MCC353]|uniref:YitT family protein n=1 Tax=Clostridium sp. MCC353 TaxID=2592646 RepID=UPI001C026832|nr:YitT family protein [Clostridium sp. MCC353]MBT9775535.1 DUF2179 domain-containing protein [Clostridium sp. MCC353]
MEMIRKKEVGKDILYDAASAFVQAIGVHCFIEPCMIAPGGASGIALLVNYLSGLPVGALTFAINIPLLILSYIFLGKSMTVKTLKTVVIMSAVLDLFVSPVFPQYLGDRLISSAFGGIFVGVGLALVFMRGSTTGGGDILAKLLQKKFPYMQTGYSLMVIDIMIITASVIVFWDIESALYGIISLVCTTQTIDAILYGMNKGTMVTVISSENERIAEEIMNQLDRGATFLKSRGAYSKAEGNTLMCVVDRKQFYIVKGIIDYYDPRAFVIVSETKEVYGEGFLDDPRDRRLERGAVSREL